MLGPYLKIFSEKNTKKNIKLANFFLNNIITGAKLQISLNANKIGKNINYRKGSLAAVL